MTRPIEDARLTAIPSVRHGFFTRAGGVSAGIYASLNCGIGSKDERAHVLENRTRVAAALGTTADRLATPYQVHSADVVVVEEAWAPGKGPKADATVTNRPGVVLGVGTADCGPILFAEPDAGVIGAAHAGWRGARAGVGEATIGAMEQLGAKRERIVAVLGPTISQENYEVGAEVRDIFVDDDQGHASFFEQSRNSGRFMFNLPGYIVARLTAAGIAASAVHDCTYADPERFFSYRRASHLGEPDYGRLLSAIALSG